MTQPPRAGCENDTECKGARICQERRCVDPGAKLLDASAPVDVRFGENAQPAGHAMRWFRGGPGHAGASEYVGPVETPTLRWEVDLGSVIFATPTISATAPDGLLVAYVGTHAGRFVGVSVDGAAAGTLVLDLNIGGRIWGTAAVDAEGRLYVGNDDDKLFAVDPQSNSVLWELALGSCSPTRAPGPEGARCDVDGGPTLGPDGDLFVGADGVYRVSRAGEIRWRWPVEPKPGAKTGADSAHTIEASHVFSTPLVTANGDIYFGAQDGHITSLSADGVLRWRYQAGRGVDVDGSPGWNREGGIVVGADDGRLFSLRADGSLRWSFLAQKDIRSAVGVGPDGTIYVTSFDRNLYALSPSGDLLWVLPTGGIVQSSPVVDAAGTIFFGSQDDHLYAVSPAGEVLWTVELPGDIDSSVSLAPDGTLVIGSDDGFLRGYAAGESAQGTDTSAP